MNGIWKYENKGVDMQCRNDFEKNMYGLMTLTVHIHNIHPIKPDRVFLQIPYFILEKGDTLQRNKTKEIPTHKSTPHHSMESINVSYATRYGQFMMSHKIIIHLINTLCNIRYTTFPMRGHVYR